MIRDSSPAATTAAPSRGAGPVLLAIARQSITVALVDERGAGRAARRARMAPRPNAQGGRPTRRAWLDEPGATFVTLTASEGADLAGTGLDTTGTRRLRGASAPSNPTSPAGGCRNQRRRRRDAGPALPAGHRRRTALHRHRGLRARRPRPSRSPTRPRPSRLRPNRWRRPACDGRRATFLPQVWDNCPTRATSPSTSRPKPVSRVTSGATTSPPSTYTVTQFHDPEPLHGDHDHGDHADHDHGDHSHGEPDDRARRGMLAGPRRRPDPGDLCPRECRLHDGQRGFCFVRANEGGRLVLTTYGRSSGFCIDPIEKKPLAHFHPGTSVLSFGTAGVQPGLQVLPELGYLQVSRDGPPHGRRRPRRHRPCRGGTRVSQCRLHLQRPRHLHRVCRRRRRRLPRARPAVNVAVTAGYVQGAARRDFFAAMDAANVDLKGFTEDFYARVTGARLRVVQTPSSTRPRHRRVDRDHDPPYPRRQRHRRRTRAMFRWVGAELGLDVPHHLSAFHPDHRMRDIARTPLATLVRAREFSPSTPACGFVYSGNVAFPTARSPPAPAAVCRSSSATGMPSARIASPPTGRPRCATILSGRFDPRARAISVPAASRPTRLLRPPPPPTGPVERSDRARREVA